VRNQFFVISIVLMLFSNSLWAASASHSIEQLSSQIAPMWRTIKPVCVMALDLETQSLVFDRLEFLDSKLIASGLTHHLSPLSRDKNKAWNNQSWRLREQLERSSLNVNERESLREYFFKLQTQTPSANRAKLVGQVQYMSEKLNLTLRKELWKTCHGLGFHSMPQEQSETAINHRWLQQENKVKHQLKQELGAFYFYSLRQVQNMELAVLAKTAKELNPWVDSTAAAIEKYFLQLRGQLLTKELKTETQAPSQEKPFLNTDSWKPVSTRLSN
jgi:hypothetical protein